MQIAHCLIVGFTILSWSWSNITK